MYSYLSGAGYYLCGGGGGLDGVGLGGWMGCSSIRGNTGYYHSFFFKIFQIYSVPKGQPTGGASWFNMSRQQSPLVDLHADGGRQSASSVHLTSSFPGPVPM